MITVISSSVNCIIDGVDGCGSNHSIRMRSNKFKQRFLADIAHYTTTTQQYYPSRVVGVPLKGTSTTPPFAAKSQNFCNV